MEKKELKKANGDVYFESVRMTDNAYVFVNWVGIQSLETMVMGYNLVLSMLKEKSCPGLLNSNRELIGPWDDAVTYLAYKWAPAAHGLGLRNVAHVLSPGIFGQRSYEKFSQLLKEEDLHLRAFEKQAQAEEWLLLHLV
ncbi:hypothetical protein TH63_06380 [Rufibacter radiotolerans]|uniref:SpoIIAA-like protein n=1 Tax=Rufibacter radiotolerans TaxID=1379910 RepID=A0A0H4W4K1_9BACT|nr:hypothetical protein [Rufibacter radiotolerans]AKQ45346.1 hypothetical protein TH63_06380 [Rufibacter radiotolerans]